ncbi:hypothetical protein Cgig2_002037 [Carnegiea gigantea]|uniref:Uncharacterized protein n=1 Tax=Carnegiea gigantea TaxID=171969 RepID=A0A9Q1QDV0_9CARY|nr:hypothetical protein Cgig2_002037 [Carnegiea gigantea]
MEWNKEYLDLILVPSGLLIMFGYHLFLLYRYLTNYKSTSIGYENHTKKAWVKGMLQIDAENRGPAFTVISSTVSAATFMASTALALTSLIGAWMGGTSSDSLVTRIIYGDTRTSMASIKYISILFFFLIAFASFIQCSRCYVHANFLLSIPKAQDPEDLIAEALVHGSNFWHVGLRAIYFAVTLLLWVFGPIPMFVSSVSTVMILHTLDVNKKPFHDFHGPTEKMLKKVREEIRAAPRANIQLGRSQGSESEPLQQQQ